MTPNKRSNRSDGLVVGYVRVSTERQATEGLIDLVAELIAEEKLKEVEFQVKGADYDSQHPLSNRKTDLCCLPDRVR